LSLRRVTAADLILVADARLVAPVDHRILRESCRDILEIKPV
jgi:hypothetical protein